ENEVAKTFDSHRPITHKRLLGALAALELKALSRAISVGGPACSKPMARTWGKFSSVRASPARMYAAAMGARNDNRGARRGRPDRDGETSMVRIALLGLSLIVVGVEAGCAQISRGLRTAQKPPA